MGVKKYKPLATPHLLGTKITKSRDRTDSAIRDGTKDGAERKNRSQKNAGTNRAIKANN